MARQSLIEFFEEYDRLGEEIAIAQRRGYRMERCTYGRVAETARAFAAELEARGVAAGERVLLWGENSAEWVAAVATTEGDLATRRGEERRAAVLYRRAAEALQDFRF